MALDLDAVRAAILNSACGTRPWDAVRYLPETPNYGQPADEAPRIWADASIADYFLVLEYSNMLLMKLISGEIPVGVDGPDRSFLLRCSYGSNTSVPQLLCVRRILDAAKYTSFQLYRLQVWHHESQTEPGTTELAAFRSQLAPWVNAPLLEFMLTASNGLMKLNSLRRAADALAVSTSWCHLDLAVDRWPESLEGYDAYAMFRAIAIDAQAIMTNPLFLVLTSEHTWAKMGDIAEVIGKSYPSAVRSRLRADNAPSESRFVAVLDPTFVLYAALIGVVEPWLTAMGSGKDSGAVTRAIETYRTVRGQPDLPETIGAEMVERYTDFVVPVEGDGLWPTSVVEVESLVREMLRSAPPEAAVNTPLTIVAEINGGWIWLETPWSLPIGLIGDENVEQWFRREPLLAWMAYTSINPGLANNIWVNHDTVVRWMEEAFESQEQRQRYQEVSRDIQSVVIPGILGATILAFLFPNVPAPELSAISAMIFPLIKLIQKWTK
jgi:hypothetical protein